MSSISSTRPEVIFVKDVDFDYSQAPDAFYFDISLTQRRTLYSSDRLCRPISGFFQSLTDNDLRQLQGFYSEARRLCRAADIDTTRGDVALRLGMIFNNLVADLALVDKLNHFCLQQTSWTMQEMLTIKQEHQDDWLVGDPLDRHRLNVLSMICKLLSPIFTDLFRYTDGAVTVFATEHITHRTACLRVIEPVLATKALRRLRDKVYASIEPIMRYALDDHPDCIVSEQWQPDIYIDILTKWFVDTDLFKPWRSGIFLWMAEKIRFATQQKANLINYVPEYTTIQYGDKIGLIRIAELKSI